jgi:hypothetical protein
MPGGTPMQIFDLAKYDRENDKHLQAVDSLVYELRMPAEEVNRSYREILDELRRSSIPAALLPLLAISSVKQRLSHPR